MANQSYGVPSQSSSTREIGQSKAREWRSGSPLPNCSGQAFQSIRQFGGMAPWIPSVQGSGHIPQGGNWQSTRGGGPEVVALGTILSETAPTAFLPQIPYLDPITASAVYTLPLSPYQDIAQDTRYFTLTFTASATFTGGDYSLNAAFEWDPDTGALISGSVSVVHHDTSGANAGFDDEWSYSLDENGTATETGTRTLQNHDGSFTTVPWQWFIPAHPWDSTQWDLSAANGAASASLSATTINASENGTNWASSLEIVMSNPVTFEQQIAKVVADVNNYAFNGPWNQTLVQKTVWGPGTPRATIITPQPGLGILPQAFIDPWNGIGDSVTAGGCRVRDSGVGPPMDKTCLVARQMSAPALGQVPVFPVAETDTCPWFTGDFILRPNTWGAGPAGQNGMPYAYGYVQACCKHCPNFGAFNGCVPLLS